MQPSIFFRVIEINFKAMKRLLIPFFILLVCAASLTAQNTETRKLDKFTRIDVGQAIRVELTQGNKHEAVVEVDGAELSEVITDVRGSTLVIKMKSNNYNYRNVDVTVYLTLQDINRLEVSSAARVTSTNIIKVKELDIYVSSAGSATLAIQSENITVDVSSAGKLELKGNTSSQDISVSSAGNYKGSDLTSKAAEINVSSGGKAEVTVSDKIDASANSGGTIRYSGNPDKVFVESNSGGSVRKS